ncbi:MAG: cellulase, partial [Hyphomicrobiales bacterium]|nr:cellulase [Hyphomicrobiales bacterium]
MNDATDGDLLIAWGLAEGARRFDRPQYRAASRKIARAILAHATFESPLGLMLKPGIAGFGPKDSKDGPVVNPSYFVFPAFDALSRVAPSPAWAKLREGGLALLAAARFGKAGLPTDWVSVKAAAPAPAATWPSAFSYDAIRVPLYLAWDGKAPKAALAPYLGAFADGAPSIVDVSGAKPDASFADAGYRAVAATALCAADGAKIPADLRSVADKRYFPATLHMMSLALWGGRLASCG